jgi:hypothetical protein
MVVHDLILPITHGFQGASHGVMVHSLALLQPAVKAKTGYADVSLFDRKVVDTQYQTCSVFGLAPSLLREAFTLRWKGFLCIRCTVLAGDSCILALCAAVEPSACSTVCKRKRRLYRCLGPTNSYAQTKPILQCEQDKRRDGIYK